MIAVVRGVARKMKVGVVVAAALGIFPLLTFMPSAVAVNVRGVGLPSGTGDRLAYANVPLSTVDPNDPVKAVVTVGDTAYIGGDFTRIGAPSGSGVVVDGVSGSRDVRWPAVTGGSVNVVVSDLRGGWYIAGTFTRVGPTPRRGLAHLRANRTLDPSWNPRFAGSDVQALAVSQRRVYVGMSVWNSRARALVVVDRKHGTPMPFRAHVKRPVTALAVAGRTLYFAQNGGAATTRNLISAVDAASGKSRGFRVRARVNPCRVKRMGNCEGFPSASTLALRGRTIFVAGFFNVVNGVRRLDAAAFDALTGKVLPWAPQPNGGIESIEIVGSDVYAGGWFTRIGGQRRLHLAMLDAVRGRARSWHPELPSARPDDDAVRDIAVGPSAVYVAANSYDIPEHGLAAYDRRSGRRLDWKPAPNDTVVTLARQGGNLFVGGSFTGVDSSTRPALAAINIKTGTLEAWNPTLTGRDWNPQHPSVNALATDGERLFVGGDFTQANGEPRASLAAFNLLSGSLDNWNPGADGDVNALAISGKDIFVGGAFSLVGNQPHRGLAKIDAAGRVSPIPISVSGNIGFVLALAAHNNTVYVGGRFANIDGVPRNNACAVDASTGAVLDWNPDTDNPVWSLAASSSTVFMGGAFSNVGGRELTGVAALDPLDGKLQRQIATQGVSPTVSALAIRTPLLYIGGEFAKVAGVPSPYLAAFHLGTQTTTNWNPRPNAEISAIVANEQAIIVGGDFDTIAGTSSPNLAVFPHA